MTNIRDSDPFSSFRKFLSVIFINKTIVNELNSIYIEHPLEFLTLSYQEND